MAQVIAKISFLFKGERVVVEANDQGTFRVPVSEVVSGRVKTKYKNLTAREIVEHPTIKEGDPVLTLNTGDKIRVFDGGDSKYLPAMSDGIISKHDKKEVSKRKFLKEKKILREKTKQKSYKIKNNKALIPPYASSVQQDTVDLDEEDRDYPLGWDEYDYFD